MNRINLFGKFKDLTFSQKSDTLNHFHLGSKHMSTFILPVMDVPLKKLYGTVNQETINSNFLDSRGSRKSALNAFLRSFMYDGTTRSCGAIRDFTVRQLLGLSGIGIVRVKHIVMFYQDLAKLETPRNPVLEVGTEHFDDGPAIRYAPAVVQHNNQIYLITDLAVYPLLDQLVNYNELCPKHKQMLDDFINNT
jgi:hypothetical protein